MLGLRLCARAFSSCGKWGPLFIAVRGPLTIMASLVAEHRLQTRRRSSCGSRAQPLRGVWDLPRPGLEPVSPALAGRLPTAAPPGKPRFSILRVVYTKLHHPLSLATAGCVLLPRLARRRLPASSLPARPRRAVPALVIEMPPLPSPL